MREVESVYRKLPVWVVQVEDRTSLALELVEIFINKPSFRQIEACLINELGGRGGEKLTHIRGNLYEYDGLEVEVIEWYPEIGEIPINYQPLTPLPIFK